MQRLKCNFYLYSYMFCFVGLCLFCAFNLDYTVILVVVVEFYMDVAR